MKEYWGIKLSEAEVLSIMTLYDADGNGTLDIDEFRTMLCNLDDLDPGSVARYWGEQIGSCKDTWRARGETLLTIARIVLDVSRSIALCEKCRGKKGRRGGATGGSGSSSPSQREKDQAKRDKKARKEARRRKRRGKKKAANTVHVADSGLGDTPRSMVVPALADAARRHTVRHSQGDGGGFDDDFDATTTGRESPRSHMRDTQSRDNARSRTGRRLDRVAGGRPQRLTEKALFNHTFPVAKAHAARGCKAREVRPIKKATSFKSPSQARRAARRYGEY